MTPSIQLYWPLYFVRISFVPSVEPSLTMTHLRGKTVCPKTTWIVCSRKAASLRAGVMRDVLQPP